MLGTLRAPIIKEIIEIITNIAIPIIFAPKLANIENNKVPIPTPYYCKNK